jgi:ribosomal protein S18 acetylase RimI-like enzyme
MLIATPGLVRRIERSARDLVVDMARASADHDPARRVSITELGDGRAIHAGMRSPLNKIVGLDGEEPLDEEALAAVEEEFERLATPLQVELASNAVATLAPALARRGYALAGCEDVLGLALDEAFVRVAEGERGTLAAAIEVEKLPSPSSRTWIDVVVTGFLHPDGSAAVAEHDRFERAALEEAFSGFVGVAGFDLYLARLSTVVAGGGAVRRRDGIAQLCGAATLPEHRRRGVQTALFRERLLDAARAGCDLAVVTTAPGSKSQQNAIERGFALLYTRAVLVRAPAGARATPAS